MILTLLEQPSGAKIDKYDLDGDDCPEPLIARQNGTWFVVVLYNDNDDSDNDDDDYDDVDDDVDDRNPNQSRDWATDWGSTSGFAG